MLAVKLICVGKMKEKYYIEAVEEYAKRLSAYCRFQIEELPEQRLSDAPSAKEIDAALDREGLEILKRIPAGAVTVAMCVEGTQRSSPALAEQIQAWANSGKSKLCFVIGGSFGMSRNVKAGAQLKLSMSEMTFPHHLARVMLCEQIYRAFTIIEGSKYHK